MKKPSIYLICISIFVAVSAPKLNAQKATVKIEQDSTITKLMETKIDIDSENYSSKFYTIQLFYGDNKRAQELFENFKKSFPNWEVNLSFETPNYKVQVGRFKDYYLGLNKLKKIKKAYPAAFLLETKD
tara:strand:- start:958 stop:1344 length:387 start_codon:yes stop_codon:yes gene_type:complete